MGIESRSLLHDGLDLEQLSVGCISPSARERLGIQLDEQRARLNQLLIEAARNLAYYNVRYQTADYLPADPFVLAADGLKCDECKQAQRRLLGGELKGEHAPGCRTGAVLAVLELLDGLKQFASNAFEGQPFFFRSAKGGRG